MAIFPLTELALKISVNNWKINFPLKYFYLINVVKMEYLKNAIKTILYAFKVDTTFNLSQKDDWSGNFYLNSYHSPLAWFMGFEKACLWLPVFLWLTIHAVVSMMSKEMRRETTILIFMVPFFFQMHAKSNPQCAKAPNFRKWFWIQTLMQLSPIAFKNPVQLNR